MKAPIPQDLLGGVLRFDKSISLLQWRQSFGCQCAKVVLNVQATCEPKAYQGVVVSVRSKDVQYFLDGI